MRLMSSSPTAIKSEQEEKGSNSKLFPAKTWNGMTNSAFFCHVSHAVIIFFFTWVCGETRFLDLIENKLSISPLSVVVSSPLSLSRQKAMGPNNTQTCPKMIPISWGKQMRAPDFIGTRERKCFCRPVFYIDLMIRLSTSRSHRVTRRRDGTRNQNSGTEWNTLHRARPAMSFRADHGNALPHPMLFQIREQTFPFKPISGSSRIYSYS